MRRELCAALLAVTLLMPVLLAQDRPGFSGLSTAPTTGTIPADAALNPGLSVYREGTELHADIDVTGGNMPPGEVFYARTERYPWRIAAVIAIEFSTYLQKMGRELKKEIGDLETLEPETLDYLKHALPAELEARMRHIIVQQQLFAQNYRILAVDPGAPPGQMPPYFYTDGAGALEILKRLGQTVQMSMFAREKVMYDIVTAILMSGPSPVRKAIGHLLDPSHFPPDPDQATIITRLNKEGLPRMMVGIGGYTVGALGILAYSLTKNGLLGYDLDFNRITVSKHLLKTDKYGFGWRIDTSGFSFDNAHAGLELDTKHATIAVLAGGRVMEGGHLFHNPETTVLASYKLINEAGPNGVSTALALLAEAHIPWDKSQQARMSAGFLLDHRFAPQAGAVDRRLIVEGRASGPVKDLDWHVNTTYKVRKSNNVNWFVGAGVGNEPPIPQRTLDTFDNRRYGGPGSPSRGTYGYGFVGIEF